MRSPDEFSESGWGEAEAEEFWAGALVLRPSVKAGGLNGLVSSTAGEPTVVVRADTPQPTKPEAPETSKEPV